MGSLQDHKFLEKQSLHNSLGALFAAKKRANVPLKACPGGFVCVVDSRSNCVWLSLFRDC